MINPIIKDQSSFGEVKPDRERLYNERLHNAIAQTIFDNSCGSVSPLGLLISLIEEDSDTNIYLNDQYFIDQKTKKNWSIYPWSSFDMWYSTHWDTAGDWVYNVSPKEYGIIARLSHLKVLNYAGSRFIQPRSSSYIASFLRSISSSYT